MHISQKNDFLKKSFFATNSNLANSKSAPNCCNE